MPCHAAAAIAAQVEFVPCLIKKVAGSDPTEAWRYLVEFTRTATGDTSQIQVRARAPRYCRPVVYTLRIHARRMRGPLFQKMPRMCTMHHYRILWREIGFTRHEST